MQNNFDDKLLNIDITDYWLILNKHFVQILLVFLLTLSATVAYTLRQKPMYQAESRVRISARSPMATIEGAQITWYGAGPSNSISSEIELIISKDEILSNVLSFLRYGDQSKVLRDKNESIYYTEEEIAEIKKLSFDGDEKTFIGSLSTDALRGMLRIEPLRTSDIILIKCDCEYPDVAIAVSNLVAIAYRADFWKCKTQDAKETQDFIKGRLDVVRSELDQNKISLEKSHEETANLGSVQRYQDELTALRIELDRLSQTYQPTHPRIVKQKQLIALIEEQLSKFPETKQSYDDNLAEWELKQEMRKTLGEYLMKAEIDFEAKKTKSKDEVQLVSKANYASKLRPKEFTMVLAGAIFGIILGCAYAFVWEGLDTSIGKIEDVERITGLPVIAHIPLIGDQGRKDWFFFRPLKILRRFLFSFLPFNGGDPPLDLDKKILFNFDILSMTAEAYRTLRTNIQFALGTQKNEGVVIEITSTSPREGKTLTSTNLAISLAQMGKVTLLLEADMRRPQIANLFKISEKPGLSDILVGTAKANDAIRTFTDVLLGNSKWEKLIETPGVDNLNIITCGTLPPNPTELLLSNEFRDLIQELRPKYDFIIVDTPPTIPVSDSSIISTVTDGTVLIYQSDTTSRHLLLRALHTLKKNHTKVLGVVINQLSFDVVLKSGKAGYRYGYGYGYKHEKGNI